MATLLIRVQEHLLPVAATGTLEKQRPYRESGQWSLYVFGFDHVGLRGFDMGLDLRNQRVILMELERYMLGHSVA